MSSSTRLYERLGEIPQDTEDPESLGDLVVCAFGAFERYYVCWKTRSGEFRQDGYDLPPSLRDWLFPTDGTCRDFASLQVVFGRGNEYFASDKNGKLEVKEPEIKKPTPVDVDEMTEKPNLRRSRTISFLRPLSDRPLSDLTAKFTTPTNDVLKMEDLVPRSRSLSAHSQPGLWTPAVSTSKPSSAPKINAVVESHTKGVPNASPTSTPTRPSRRSRSSSVSFNPGPFPKIIEGKTLISQSSSPTKPPAHCICICHASKSNSLYISTPTFIFTEPMAIMSNPVHSIIKSEPKAAPLPKSSKSTIASIEIAPVPPPTTINSEIANISTQTDPIARMYPVTSNHNTAAIQTNLKTLPIPSTTSVTDSSMQTDPITPFVPPRSALRINTVTDNDTASLTYSEASSASDVQTPLTEILPAPNPVYMGRMMDYFSKPGYQLGDSLFSSYRYSHQSSYQDRYGKEEEWGSSVAERRQTV